MNFRHMNDMNLKKKLNYRRVILLFQGREGFIKNTKKKHKNHEKKMTKLTV